MNLVAETKLDLDDVRKYVENMKEYVEYIWTEYESVAHRTDEELAPAAVPELRDFVARIQDGSFQRLKDSYRSARLALLSQMAELAGASVEPAPGRKTVTTRT